MGKGRRNRKLRMKMPQREFEFGVEPSIPKTSEELREINEIKSKEDLYSNIYFLDWEYEGQTIWDDEEGQPIPHGFGKETFTNVSPIVNAFTDGEEKEVSYEGGFKNGKRDGYGLLELNTGTTYEGFFVNGKKHGKGFINYRTSRNFIHSGKDLVEMRREYNHGELVGMCECIFEDGFTNIVSAETLNNRVYGFNELDKTGQLIFNSFAENCVS